MQEIENKSIKILLSGGGSGGPVAPLIGIADSLKNSYPLKNFDFLWIGTNDGPEKEMLLNTDIIFTAIACGKWRRYSSFKNITDIFQIVKGFFESIKIIKKFRPDIVISVGGFVSVPVAFAAKFLNVPILIHQQDARPGLANKIMAPFARVITVTFEKSLLDYGQKAIWVGNSVRKEFKENRIDKRTALQKLGLDQKKPTVLILGGGTGSMALNRLVNDSLNQLTAFCQILHISGKNKDIDFDQLSAQNGSYRHFDFLNIEGMIKVFTVADVVVSRCGMSTLSELSHLKKASILIPMPNSHQEDNALVFKEQNAALILEQNNLNSAILISEIKKILNDLELKVLLENNIAKVIKTEENLLPEIIINNLK